MKYKAYKASVVGYKNILKGNKSQDYCEYKIFENGILGVLGDGHSTEFFKYSYEGAQIACKAAISVLEKYLEKFEDIERDLKLGLIQKRIYETWKNLVNEHYKKNNPVVFKTEYIKYGTTLVAVLVRTNFRLYLKLGDGNIVATKDGKYSKVIDNKVNGVVDSMGREGADKNMIYRLEKVDKDNILDYIILFTDGYENGFDSDKEMFEDLNQTISKYGESVFSRMMLYKNYKSHLNKISKTKSHDDISIIFLAFD